MTLVGYIVFAVIAFGVLGMVAWVIYLDHKEERLRIEYSAAKCPVYKGVHDD